MAGRSSTAPRPCRTRRKLHLGLECRHRADRRGGADRVKEDGATAPRPATILLWTSGRGTHGPPLPATARTIRRVLPPRSPASSGSGDHCAAALHGRAERDGRDSAHTARPPSAIYRRARTHGLAESVRRHDRARAEAAIGRFKQVIGDGLRSRTDGRRATEVDVAVHALNRMLELGRPNYVRIA